MPKNNTKPAAHELVGYQRVSVETGLSTSILRGLVRREAIPHLRLGPRTVRFRMAEIALWLRKSHRPVEPCHPPKQECPVCQHETFKGDADATDAANK